MDFPRNDFRTISARISRGLLGHDRGFVIEQGNSLPIRGPSFLKGQNRTGGLSPNEKKEEMVLWARTSSSFEIGERVYSAGIDKKGCARNCGSKNKDTFKWR